MRCPAASFVVAIITRYTIVGNSILQQRIRQDAITLRTHGHPSAGDTSETLRTTVFRSQALPPQRDDHILATL
jgi:hypothetical protein